MKTFWSPGRGGPAVWRMGKPCADSSVANSSTSDKLDSGPPPMLKACPKAGLSRGARAIAR